MQPKKYNFINRIKYAELKVFCIGVDVYKIYEADDYFKIFEVLSTLQNKKLKINNFLIEKYKELLENRDFEQNYFSKQQQVFIKLDMILLD